MPWCLGKRESEGGLQEWKNGKVKKDKVEWEEKISIQKMRFSTDYFVFCRYLVNVADDHRGEEYFREWRRHCVNRCNHVRVNKVLKEQRESINSIIPHINCM